MSHARTIERLRAGFLELAQAMDELIEAEDWIDQKASPLGRTLHCKAARSGELKARKVHGKWLARRSDVDAYIEAHGMRPPAEREGIDDDKAVADILQFRAPKRHRK